MKTKTEYKINIVITICLGVLAFIFSYSRIFYSIDKIFSDPLYQVPTPTDSQIKIIAIDEKTLTELGGTNTWTRDIPAQLVEKLIENPETAPAVIAFDIMYFGEQDKNADERFAQACKKAGNVITALNVVIRPKIIQTEDGEYIVDDAHIELVEYPYKALREVSAGGYANTVQDVDGYIRYARTHLEHENQYLESLEMKIYKMYCKNNNTEVKLPKTFGNNLFYFTYSGKNEAYEVVSLCDVLSGKVDIRAFKNSIVLIGAYAPGMQDAYNVAVQKGAQMYGVEIHANILEAMMEQKTAVPVSNVVYAVIVAVVTLLFYIVCRKISLISSAILLVVMIGVDVLVGKLLYKNGYFADIIYLPIFMIVGYAFQLGWRYLVEKLRRNQVVSAFKKYVAPQVVDEISKKGDFQMVLGGENRHIAVLFVDIRGFTPMSENLEPEQIVDILNEYLNLTTNAIFKNGGTLDKFIGDATMAVFNAPFDLDDYIYRAVCTARDIAAGSEELQKRLMQRFGKSISFGIGVNCGNAVVGNIGCEFRMDYTAIGDTVNTAARLESNAGKGQILISQDVYEAVKDRVTVTEVGVIPLKGKSNGVFVYQLDTVKEV